MVKVEKTTPEPTVTLTTTLYGAEFIQRCLKFYVSNAAGVDGWTATATAQRLVDAINCPGFDYYAVKVNKLFR